LSWNSKHWTSNIHPPPNKKKGQKLKGRGGKKNGKTYRKK
jgi:hypothetical protein